MDLGLIIVSDDQGEGVVVVEIRGECDISAASMLRERLLDVVVGQSAKVVLDLAGLSFLDCAGARVLVAAARRATLLGGMLAIARPGAPVVRLLRLTSLDQRLAVFGDVEQAVAALRRGDYQPEPVTAGPLPAIHGSAWETLRAAALRVSSAARDTPGGRRAPAWPGRLGCAQLGSRPASPPAPPIGPASPVAVADRRRPACPEPWSEAALARDYRNCR